MGYRSLTDCVNDLERNQHLIRIDSPVDPNLEAAEIQRRVYQAGGPAILFTNVLGSTFPMCSNLFGTLERARFIFRDTFENVQRAIQLKVDPSEALKQPLKYWRAPFIAMQMRPKAVRSGPVIQNETKLTALPQLKSWPDDGGAFITLPQVYSEDVRAPGLNKSNMGMYRVQLSGNRYSPDKEVGLHYQIHRGIGVHHRAAIDAGKPFRVNIFVGGNPAMTVAAVMPLPEGMSELTFAGALAGHRIPMIRQNHAASIYSQADFCIVGTIDPNRQLPEGPFGDHLGYYSLQHDFPVLNVEKVYHRKGAIWPFTVVGRPPQEDTVFGELIHELTGPVIPTVLPGIKAVNAVDASGVHPLLLAVGSERYVPYRPTTQPQELLTQANAILGQGQMSLAKYVWIIDEACDPNLDVNEIDTFFIRMLERVNWKRDLHFQTRTTIDTLDYSGSGFNEGSKVVIAAAGPPVRKLPMEIPANLRLPNGYSNPQICLPGVLAIAGPKFNSKSKPDHEIRSFCNSISAEEPINQFPLILIVDDSQFSSGSINNFLWIAFTRSNPASDLEGIEASIESKHWGCAGSLVIDARIKPHHAPPLIEDPEITKRVDAMAARGGKLAKYL
ncbi:MAG: UbiD family decarboxylase [Mariniblastus sp.]|nr:UbiD family decarboxylase [Mariniblastus sp.]